MRRSLGLRDAEIVKIDVGPPLPAMRRVPQCLPMSHHEHPRPMSFDLRFHARQ